MFSLSAAVEQILYRKQSMGALDFCVPDTKFVSATNVARAGKRGKICVGNNVFSFASTLIKDGAVSQFASPATSQTWWICKAWIKQTNHAIVVVIYSVDSFIQPLNNPGQKLKTLCEHVQCSSETYSSFTSIDSSPLTPTVSSWALLFTLMSCQADSKSVHRPFWIVFRIFRHRFRQPGSFFPLSFRSENETVLSP